MEFTVTKEFIIEAHKAACLEWKERIENEFPKAFETQLEVGKWYKNANETIVNYQGGRLGYGFAFGNAWYNNNRWGDFDTQWKEATHEEVEAALIAEAKKRGYVGKEIVLIKGAIGSHSDVKMQENFSFEAYKNRLMCHCETYGSFTIFQDGKWAEILPEEKTIITKGKALRIIAKKLKVSPESIEIQ